MVWWSSSTCSTGLRTLDTYSWRAGLPSRTRTIIVPWPSLTQESVTSKPSSSVHLLSPRLSISTVSPSTFRTSIETFAAYPDPVGVFCMQVSLLLLLLLSYCLRSLLPLSGTIDLYVYCMFSASPNPHPSAAAPAPARRVFNVHSLDVWEASRDRWTSKYPYPRPYLIHLISLSAQPSPTVPSAPLENPRGCCLP